MVLLQAGQGWLLDASVAFILILVLSQLCLLWLSTLAGQKPLLEGAEKQKQLIEASDRLINDPACLAKVKNGAAVPQSIVLRNLSAEELAYCCGGCHYSLGTRQGVQRLVLFGGVPAVLSVW